MNDKADPGSSILHSNAKSRNARLSSIRAGCCEEAETRRIDQLADAVQQQHSLWPRPSRSSAAYPLQVFGRRESANVQRGDDGHEDGPVLVSATPHLKN